MARRFEAAGLEYNPNPEVVPNTMDALRLTELARDLGRHGDIHDRVMDAYWRDGHTAPVWFLQDPARTDTELIVTFTKPTYGAVRTWR